MTSRSFRSLLFTPATSPRKIEKAFSSSADGVILDLEDSVAASEKPAARKALLEALAAPRSLPAFVRINAVSSPYHENDLVALGDSMPYGVMVPKVETVEEIRGIEAVLHRIEKRHHGSEGDIEILPIIETARGLQVVSEIARCSSRVRRLTFGAIDLALDLDIRLDEPFGAIDHARFTVAVASRAAGLLPPFDTAFADFVDLAQLRVEALRARSFGYHGKGCIHPAQIDVVNEVFTPSEAELAQAHRIVEAFEDGLARGAGAIRVDGRMVDYPVVLKAQRLIASAGTGAGQPGDSV